MAQDDQLPDHTSSRSSRWSSGTTPASTMDWGALSHPGYDDTVNTDTFYLGRFDRTLEPILTSLTQVAGVSWHHLAGYVAVVADGLDAGAIGEVASRTAVSTLLDLTLETPDWIMRLDEATLADRVSQRVANRLHRVDQLLTSIGEATLRPESMGTTMTIVAVLPPDGLVVHTGHSRAYLQRQQTLTRLTRDHTASQALADAGMIDDDDVAHHAGREVVLKAIGLGEGRLGADVTRFHLEPGDRVVVCSDGLTAAVSDDELNEVLSASASSALACRALVDLALARGGHDNVTVAVGRWQVEVP